MRNTTSNTGAQSINNELISAKKGNTSNSKVADKVSQLVSQYLAMAFLRDLKLNSGLALLLECYLIAAGEKANEKVKDILFKNDFREDVLTPEELKFLSEHIEELFENLVSSDNIISNFPAGYAQPQEVTDFVCAVAGFPEDILIYNPFAGLNSYSISLPNEYEGEEINPQAWALGQIRLFAAGADLRSRIKLDDSFKSLNSDKKYKAIITSAPYLMEKGHNIGDLIAKMYDKLENGGTLACIVPSLFLSNISSIKIRQRLIQDKALKAVITLPSNIFVGTGTSQAVIIVTKGTDNDFVLFADASGYTRFAKSVYRMTTFEWKQFLNDMEHDADDYWDRGSYIIDDCVSVPLPYDQIVDYSLIPARYLIPMPKDGIKLSELATELDVLQGEEATAEYMIAGSSIPRSMHGRPFIPSKSENINIANAKNQVQINEDTVIIAMVDGEVRSVYTENFFGKISLSGDFIKVLKPVSGVSAKYLASLLSEKVVCEQIEAQCVGLTTPTLRYLDLAAIIVPNIRTAEEREKLIDAIISLEMRELERENTEALERTKRELRSTRHAMVQTLSALSSNWNQLQIYTENNGGKIDVTDTFGVINPISIKRLMKTISYNISTLRNQVEVLRFDKRDWGKDSEINPNEFINEYIALHETPTVKMVNLGKNNITEYPGVECDTTKLNCDHTVGTEIFYAPKKMLEQIFNNIVANAKAHGFVLDRSNNEIRFDWMNVDGNIVITIANNGAPLKPGTSANDVFMSGYSTALNENAPDGTLHSGHGCFQIKSLMEGLGSVDIISEPDEEFPVIYKLTFKKTN